MCIVVVVRSPVVRVGDLGVRVLLVEFVNCCSYRMFTSGHSGRDVIAGWGGARSSCHVMLPL